MQSKKSDEKNKLNYCVLQKMVGLIVNLWDSCKLAFLPLSWWEKKMWNFHSKNDKFEIGLRQVALSNIQFVEFCIQFGLFICN